MADIIAFPFGSRRREYDKPAPLKSERRPVDWYFKAADLIKTALAKIAEEMRG
jgi:hypothetical protein